MARIGIWLKQLPMALFFCGSKLWTAITDEIAIAHFSAMISHHLNFVNCCFPHVEVLLSLIHSFTFIFFVCLFFYSVSIRLTLRLRNACAIVQWAKYTWYFIVIIRYSFFRFIFTCFSGKQSLKEPKFLLFNCCHSLSFLFKCVSQSFLALFHRNFDWLVIYFLIALGNIQKTHQVVK